MDQLFVDGVDIIKDTDHKIECGGGTVSFDPNTNTLTLENAAILKGTSKGIDTKSSFKGSWNLKLIGTNTIGTEERPLSTGIYTRGGVNVTGDGSLHIYADDGVYSPKGCSVAGAEIDLEGTGIVRDEDESETIGISCSGSAAVQISDQAKVSIKSYNLGINCPDNGFSLSGTSTLAIEDVVKGISGGDIYSGGEFSITDSTLAVTAEKNCIDTGKDVPISGTTLTLICENEGRPIATNRNIAISGSNGTVTSAANNCLYAKGETSIDNSRIDMEARGDFPAIWSKGPITLSGLSGNLTSSGGNVINARNDLIISNTQINASTEGNLPALYCEGDLRINGKSVVAAESADDYAIFAGNTAVFDDSKVQAASYGGIKAAADLTIQNADIIANSEGSVALESGADLSVAGSGSIRAESKTNLAIYAPGAISFTGDATVSAAGKAGGISAEGMITIDGADVSAVATDESVGKIRYGVYSKSGLDFESGRIYAKGIYAGIYVKKLKTANEDPVKKITVAEGYEEITGGKLSVTPWVESKNKWYSYTSFIPGNASSLSGDMSNALKEITIQKKAPPAPVYTVTFDSMGGTSLNPMAVVSGGIIPQPQEIVREGYLFTGWYQDMACTQAWDFDQDTVTGNTTLYAGWKEAPAPEKGYTVTFDSRGGSSVAAIPDLKAGSLLEEPQAPAREFYAFDGWYRDISCTQPWDFSKDTVSGDITLYAGWHPCKPAAPQIKVAAISTTAVRLTWDEVPGVTGYVVYGYTGAAKDFDTRAIVRKDSSTSYTDKGLKPGTQRSYIVRAYKNLEGRNYYSGMSNREDTATRPMAAAVKSITPGRGTAYVVLKEKARGAEGYAYCASRDGKDYVIIAKGPKEPYRMRQLSKGRNFIKVRSYRKTIQGKTIYGDWSAVQTVSVR